MIWLTNTYDPTREDAKYSLSVALNENRDEQWAKYLVWLDGFIIGRPAAGIHSVEELEAMGMVGVYRKDDRP